MSRLEREFTASGEPSLSVADLLALLDGENGSSEAERAQAIACFLSAGEGWRDAVKRLGGAFATDGTAPELSGRTGLRDGKAE